MKVYRASCETCGFAHDYRSEAKAEFSLRQHSCERWLAKAAAAERGRLRDAKVERTPKPCLHKQTRHEHGTHATYVLDKCRCLPCAHANAAYEQRRSKLHAYGRFTHLVDAEPARQHVRALMAAGLGLKRIVALSGFSQGAMTKLMYGTDGHGPSKRIHRDNAAKLLAVQADLTTLAGGVNIDGTGARRRVRALIAVGWSQSKLAREVGMTPRNFNHFVHDTGLVSVATHRTVAALYDQLWNTLPDTSTAAQRGAYNRSLRYAAARQWAPPLAWDDDAIDDPDAGPATATATATARPGRGRRAEDTAEDVEWLLEQDPIATAQHIADRLHIGADAIQHACRRAGRQDLLDRLNRNARLQREGTAA